MPSKEELEIAIKVAKELEHPAYADDLKMKLLEISFDKDEIEFLQMFEVWINSNRKHEVSNAKLVKLIYGYLRDNWEFSVVKDPAAPLAEQVEGWTYFNWADVPYNSLVSVMDGSRYIYKDQNDSIGPYIKMKSSHGLEFWKKVPDAQDVNNFRPFLVVKKDLRVDQVSTWWDQNIEGK